MESKDPDELMEEYNNNQESRCELAKDVLDWFLDDENLGRLFPRVDIVEKLSDEMDITIQQSGTAISDTVGDIVDPVQQIPGSNNRYVGVIDYTIFEDQGAYGYIDFDDKKGKRKRVVCARCVEKHKYDDNIVHATQGEGSSNEDASWQQLLNKVTSHYANDHTEAPSSIEPGASLINGTTISGNTAFHKGNDGLGSGLVADEVKGSVDLSDSDSTMTVPTGTDQF